jgi:hypothetical protein
MEVREKGGQQYSPMIRGFQLYQTEWRVNQTADGQPGDRPMDRKGNDQRDMLEGKGVEAGQSTIGNGSKSRFLGSFDSYESLFYL